MTYDLQRSGGSGRSNWSPQLSLIQPIRVTLHMLGARRSMRSFVTSIPGLRSNPGPVRFCAQCAPSARHLFIPFVSLRSAINALKLCPITGQRLMQSFPLRTAAATAFTTTANNTPSIRHQPRPHVVDGRALSARRKGPSSGPAKLLKPPSSLFPSSVLVNRPVSPRPAPPTTALVGSLGFLC
jgi:hypothetical protein